MLAFDLSLHCFRAVRLAWYPVRTRRREETSELYRMRVPQRHHDVQRQEKVPKVNLRCQRSVQRAQ